MEQHRGPAQAGRKLEVGYKGEPPAVLFDGAAGRLSEYDEPGDRGMPLHWTIDHDERLVIAVAEGNLATSDVEPYLGQVVAEAAMSYRKIFDVSSPRVSLAIPAMQALGRSRRRFGN